MMEEEGMETLDDLETYNTVEKLIECNLKKFIAKNIIEGFARKREPQQLMQQFVAAPPKNDIPEEEEKQEEQIVTDSKIEKPRKIDEAQCGVYVAYETFEDTTSEGIMSKIRLVEGDFNNLVKDISSFAKISVFGLYGSFLHCIQFCQKLFDFNFSNLVSEKLKNYNEDFEGVIFLRSSDKLIMLYKAPQEMDYKYIQKITSEDPQFQEITQRKPLPQHAPTYIRYLIDVCQEILAVTGDDFEFNPDTTSPFIQVQNPSLVIKSESELPIQKSHKDGEEEKEEEKQVRDDLTLREIFSAAKVFDAKNSINECTFSQADNSEIIVSAKIDIKRKESKRIENKQLIDLYLLQTGEFNKQFSDFQYVDFDYVKNEMLRLWPSSDYYFRSDKGQGKHQFLDTSFDLLCQFIDKSMRSELGRLLKEIQFKYYEEIVNLIKKLNEEKDSFGTQFLDELIEKLNKNRCEKIANYPKNECSYECSLHLNKIVQTNFKQFLNQNYLYNTVMDNIKKTKIQLSMRIHRTQQNALKNFYSSMVIEYKQKIEKFNEKRNNAFNNFRLTILQETFSQFDNLFNKVPEVTDIKCIIKMCQINVISKPSQDGKSQNHFKISYPFNDIDYRFGKDFSSSITLKNILMTSYNYGFALIEDTTYTNKNSILMSFEKPEARLKKKIFLKQINNFMHNDIQIGIESKDRMLFYSNTDRVFTVCNYSIQSLSGFKQYPQIYAENENFQIKKAVFLNSKDKIFILFHFNTNIYEFDIETEELSIVMKSQIIEGELEEIPLSPEDPSDQFTDIVTTNDGKYIIVTSGKHISIFDTNFIQQACINKEGQQFQFMKVFAYQNQSYLALRSAEKFTLHQFHSKTETKIIKTEISGREDSLTKSGNPIFDVVHYALKKFGPQSKFVGCPNSTKLIFFSQNKKIDLQIPKQYFENLKLYTVKLNIPNSVNKILQKVHETQSNIYVEFLIYTISTRLALHVATIDNMNLIPLSNGVNISDQIIDSLRLREGDENQDKNTENRYDSNNEQDNYQQLQQNQNQPDSIQKIVSMIRFGIYEKVLSLINEDIYVISIVGAQSGGKSYIMNRLFGTRFDVSAARCTDGIWMSLSKIKTKNNQTKNFMVLDCEGLFSQQRNEQEDMKFCLALSALSDIMILNQGLNFSRHQSQLFQSFTRSVGKIKGRQLFKGKLMLLIRDLTANQFTETMTEIQNQFQNIMKIENNFLTKIFGGQLLSHGLNYFGMPDFDNEVDDLREKVFLALDTHRWKSGKEILDNFKIVLSQIFTDDDTDIDAHNISIICDQLYLQYLSSFYSGEFPAQKDQHILKSQNKNNIYEFEISGVKYTIDLDKIDFKLEKMDASVFHKTFPRKKNQVFDMMIEEEIKDGEMAKWMTEAEDFQNVRTGYFEMEKGENSIQENNHYKFFQSQSQSYEIDIHNQWVAAYSKFIEQFYKKRIQKTLIFFENALREVRKDLNSQENEPSGQYAFKFKNDLEAYRMSQLLCDKNCRICDRKCFLKSNHKQNCDCKTNHMCGQVCTITDSCKDQKYTCVEIYGHEKDHRCSEGNHLCASNCSVEGCLFMCSLDNNHIQYAGDLNSDSSISPAHNCGNKHPCDTQCDFCKKTCQIDRQIEHETHDCGDLECPYKCEFCDRRCSFQKHSHQKMIVNKEKDNLQFQVSEDTTITIDYHICDQAHICSQVCDQKGTCSVDYQLQDKLWQNEHNQFKYNYFKPIEIRRPCNLHLEPYYNNHNQISDQHQCGLQQHKCNHGCPECKSFCQLQIDHEGLHQTKNHRNKEQSVFVASEKQKYLPGGHKSIQDAKEESKQRIQVKTDDGKQREYNVGESCAPENCEESCARKGRGHFHLKECLNHLNCKTDSIVSKHSDERYRPFIEKNFDKWICYNYWKSFGWEQPVSDAEKLKEIASCNYYCSSSEHRQAQSILQSYQPQQNLLSSQNHEFCTQKIWHKSLHKFNCGHTNNNQFEFIDIVFCVDVTGSMEPYILETINTINKLVQKIEKPSEQNKNVLYGFVGYRDHQDEHKTFLVKVMKLSTSNTITRFIENKITAGGGGGDGPEAVMDGLYASIHQINWRKNSARYIFHICDSPPHGREYGSGEFDDYPKGCPCGITIEHIAQDLKKEKISYKLIQIKKWVNKMAEIFKREIQNFERISIQRSIELAKKVSDVIVRDLQCDEIDVMIQQMPLV